MLYPQISIALKILALSLVLTACGITAPAGNEGFADLDSLGFWDVDTTMTLSIGPSVLGLAAANIEDDPEARLLVENLDGVRVKTYDIVGNTERVAQRIDQMGGKLRAQGWEPVVMVQAPGERTLMLMKTRGESIVGLTVITSDAHEAVVVNVMGTLHPDMFAETMVALEVDMPAVQVASTR